MSTTALLSDFPDALSPMVVKELRQGLRTRMFSAVLLVLHTLMLVITLIAGAAEDASDLDGMRLGLIGLILCFVLPLRGFSALAGEIHRNTMDMLVLTRLSAGRIVLGKWASLTAQSLLIAVSLLPYVVARYLYGGQNLLSEAGLLGLMWLIGAVITAGVVCLSTQKVFWLRAAVVILFGIVPLWMGFIFLITSAFGGGGAFPGRFSTIFPLAGVFDSGGWMSLALITGFAAWAVFFFLSLAATRVAPPSENLAMLKRCVHGGLILALVGWSFIDLPRSDLLGLAVFILSFATIDAMTERNPEVTSLYLPFFRRGAAVRIAAWLLTPGWMTGFVFSALLTALLTWRFSNTMGPAEAWMAILGVVDVWMVSALVLVSSGRKSRDLLGPWIVVFIIKQVVQYFLTMVSMIPSTLNSQTPWGLSFLPGLASAGYTVAQTEDQSLFLAISAACASLWPVILLVATIVAALRSRPLRREARLLAAELAAPRS